MLCSKNVDCPICDKKSDLFSIHQNGKKHAICKGCAREWVIVHNNTTCPMCRASIDPAEIQNMRIQPEVENMRIQPEVENTGLRLSVIHNIIKIVDFTAIGAGIWFSAPSEFYSGIFVTNVIFAFAIALGSSYGSVI
jgi:hypothetical protein